MPLIENQLAFVASAGFAAASVVFAYFMIKSEGYGDFTVGISLLDLYSIILVLVPLTAAASYFMMSFGLGTIIVDGVPIAWLRYFEWMITTPILIGGLAVLAMDKKLTLGAMILDFFMVITGFTAVILPMPWKAAMFSVSSILFLALTYLMVKPFAERVKERPDVITRLFTDLRNLTIGLWLIYPMVWILSVEGFRIISAEQSFTAFMTLDLVSKIGYAFLVLRNLEKVNESGPSGI